MPILNFKSPFQRTLEPVSTQEPAGTDWSQQEMADFYRAHRLLVEHGAGIGLDCGTSDNDDPWMVFYDLESQDVFLHVARTYNECVLICDPLNMRLTSTSVSNLIVQFEHSVRKYLSIRSERSGNVVVHPAARVIMSMAAVFLLLKLESGEAQARAAHTKGDGTKLAVDGDSTSETVTKGADKSAAILGRVQQVFSRPFDAIDSPVAAAMLAGMILAGELSLAVGRSTTGPAESAPTVDEIALADTPATADKIHDDDQVVALNGPAAGKPMHVKPDTMGDKAVAIDLDKLVLLETNTVLVEKVALKSEAAQPTFAQPRAEAAADKTDPADTEPAKVKGAASEALQIVTSPKEGESDAISTTATKALESDAIKALQGIIGEGIELKLNQDVLDALDAADKDTITDITIAGLGAIDEKVGYFVETNLSSAELLKLLDHYAAHVDGYDFQFSSAGQVLIEYSDVADLEDKDIGLLTNTMSDGSKMSIVGSAALIDDVVTFFA